MAFFSHLNLISSEVQENYLGEWVNFSLLISLQLCACNTNIKVKFYSGENLLYDKLMRKVQITNYKHISKEQSPKLLI